MSRPNIDSWPLLDRLGRLLGGLVQVKKRQMHLPHDLLDRHLLTGCYF